MLLDLLDLHQRYACGPVAADHLIEISADIGTAGCLLKSIGSGITVGGALVDYSNLETGTAYEHLLAPRNEKSGVSRLWMYELYEQAILEDEQRKQPVQATKPVKTTTSRRATATQAAPEQPAAYKPLPVTTLVQPAQPEISEIVTSFLETLKSDPVPEIHESRVSISKSKQTEVELLLLLSD